VTELTTHIQGLNGKLEEKTSTIEDLRRQIDRSMSNNRLMNFRTSKTNSRRSF
jgi:regulator of replication initiation timing